MEGRIFGKDHLTASSVTSKAGRFIETYRSQPVKERHGASPVQNRQTDTSNDLPALIPVARASDNRDAHRIRASAIRCDWSALRFHEYHRDNLRGSQPQWFADHLLLGVGNDH